MSHNDWYKYAYVDYFSSFLKLWIAFNNWYENNYIKNKIEKKNLKDLYDSLISETIKPFNILKWKWLIDEIWWKIEFKDVKIQKKEDFLTVFRDIIEEKALNFWNILVLDKFNDSEYVKKVWDDYKNSLPDLLDNINFSKTLYELSNKINHLYDNDKKVQFSKNQESDILNFVSNIIKDSELNINYWYKELWLLEKEDFNSKQEYRIYELFNEIKDDINETDIKNNIWDIVQFDKKIEDQDNILFLSWFELKTILLLIYFVRNKLVHWELNPSNDNHYEIIKLSFYIMDDIFKYLTK